MAFTVQILCPNGKRQNIKSKFSTTLLEVLEDCCKKQGFLPPEDYSLMHGRTVLDLTLSFRYLNLTNNAKLDLVKSDKPRKESEILVALQLSDGTRLQNNFLPKVTLWEIVEHWQKKADNVLQPLLKTEVDTTDEGNTTHIHPVCIYTREEIVGEMALKNTPLRKLGLTGGKAVIRLIHRNIDENTYAEIKERINKEQNKKIKLDEIAARHLREEEAEQASSVGDNTSDMDISSPLSEMQPKAQLSGFKEKASVQENVTQVGPQNVTQMEQQQNVTQMEQQQNVTQMEQQQNVTQMEQQQNVTQMEQQNVTQMEQQQNVTQMEQQQNVTQMEQQQNVTQMEQQQNVTQMRQKQNVTQIEKPHVQEKFCYHESVTSSVDFMVPDRNRVIFNRSEIQQGTDNEDLPDEFYEITKADVMHMMSDLQRKSREFDDAPLMTKTFKESKIFESYSKYKTARIKICFPDHLILQGTFHPKETVASLYQFVRENLEDSNISFYLYMSPPKKILKNLNENLILAKLVPASVVFFGSSIKRAHFLKEDLMAQVTSKMDIDNRCLYTGKGKKSQITPVPNVQPVSNLEPTPSTSKDNPTASRPSSSKSNVYRDKSNFVPKWFNLGKK
ncbi:tether containing UBX domain for GLUT4-like isoform X1 [Argonauta hians]